MSDKKWRKLTLSRCMRPISLAAAGVLTALSAHAAPVAQGSAFQVNATATSFPNVGGPARVAMAADGRFAIAWSAMEGGDTSFNIYARLFASDGTPLGSEFMANSTPASSASDKKLLPAIAMDANGNFVVGWSDGVPAAGGFNYRARMFSADGTPLGADFCVDANCPGATAGAAESEALALAIDNAGNWVASWNEVPEDQIGVDGTGIIKVRRFNRNGTPKDVAPVVITGSKGNGIAPTLAISRTSGDYAVAWWNGVTTRTTPYRQNASESVQLQRYSANGSAAGAAVSVATCSSVVTIAGLYGCTLSQPLVTSDDASNVTIQWQQATRSTVKTYAARLQAVNSTSDRKFTVMSAAQDNSTIPSAAAEDGAGKFVSVWQSGGTPAVLGRAVAANNRLDGGSFQISPAGIYSNNAGFSMNDTDDAIAVWVQSASGAVTINAQRYRVE